MKAKIISFSLGVFLISSCGLAQSEPGIYPLSKSECMSMHDNNVITDANPVPCSRLSKVIFTHVDFDGMVKQGQVVVLDIIANNTYEVFNELYSKKIPINKAMEIGVYKGDDVKSMADNNTSAFNGRAITGGGSWSKHAYGVAIDINPLQNPFIQFKKDEGIGRIDPPASAEGFVNRNELRPGRATREGMAEEMVDTFYNNGFLIWGGEWNDPVDYQHFEIGSRAFIEELVSMPQRDAIKTYKDYVAEYRACLKDSIYTDYVLARNDCVVKVKR